MLALFLFARARSPKNAEIRKQLLFLMCYIDIVAREQ